MSQQPRAHYYAGGTLNRASWLRDAVDTINSAFWTPQSRIVLFDKSNPLCHVDVQSKAASLVNLPAELIKPHLSSAGNQLFRSPKDFTKAFTAEEEGARPLCVFLGLEDDDASGKASNSALPEGDKIKENDRPYFALDASDLPDLKQAAVAYAVKQNPPASNKEEDQPQFLELRSGVIRLSDAESGLVAEAKSLLDWNKRNKFCAGCGRPTASVWCGWKRVCSIVAEGSPATHPCVSKQGVANFSYPRTDSVVIMAILHPTEDKILLGRNRAWPKGFVSCLAGFLEPGESLESAVRREVYEEAGVRVGRVGYHSSQPWPYPSSLMLGCWGIAEPDQVIRTDLDNELEQAVFVSREFVQDALENRSGLTRQDVDAIEAQQAASAQGNVKQQSAEEAGLGAIRLPPDTAIAHQLIRAWLNGEITRPGSA